MTHRLEMAIRAARLAGKGLLAQLHNGREIHSKGRRDIVTDADYAADRTIREILLSHFPHDKLLSEEGTVVERKQLLTLAKTSDQVALWVVDPLDGTTNYSRALHPFAVSIALYRAGTVQIGVVYDPVRDELFSAERGAGAYLNDKPIRVSSKRKMEDAVIGTEWARLPQVRRRTGKIFLELIDRTMTGRAFGSAAISLCCIAAGRMDGYLHLSLSPWDVAAGALIVEEAGGRVTTPTGAPWRLESKAYVASNGLLHSRILRFME